MRIARVFEQSIGLLMKMDGKLRETKKRLREMTVKVSLEEIVIRQAYQGNECWMGLLEVEESYRGEHKRRWPVVRAAS
jgi:hypothetical protein